MSRNCTIVIIKRYNHYQTLNVNSNATSKDIKESYYKLSKKYHPDVNKETNSEEKFKEIQAAYHVLGDEERKLEYDNKSKSVGSQEFSGDESPFKSPINFNNEYRRRWKAQTENRKYSGSASTGTYDFNEYYRMHYGEQIRRRQKALEYEAYLRKTADAQYTKRSAMDHDLYAKETSLANYVLFIFSLAFFVCVIMYISELKEKEDEFLRLKSIKIKNNANNNNK